MVIWDDNDLFTNNPINVLKLQMQSENKEYEIMCITPAGRYFLVNSITRLIVNDGNLSLMTKHTSSVPKEKEAYYARLQFQG